MIVDEYIEIYRTICETIYEIECTACERNENDYASFFLYSLHANCIDYAVEGHDMSSTCSLLKAVQNLRIDTGLKCSNLMFSPGVNE